MTQAKGGLTNSGFVKTSTGTPIALAVDDPSVGVATISVADGLVHDSTVRTPVAFGGTNSDGTPIYKLTTDGGTDIGGISAAKVIMINFTQTLEAGWNYLRGVFSSLQSAFLSHYTATLGLVNTHPLPTASQVGAAPVGHMGLALGIGSPIPSHPPVVVTDTGGFDCRSSAILAPNDPGFGISVSGTPIASMNHDGDIYSYAANLLSAVAGGGRAGNGVGAMGLLSHIAAALTQHVNQISHANPHGLTAGDLGALTPSSITLTLTASGGCIAIPTTSHTLLLQWVAGTPVYSNAGGNADQYVSFPVSFPTTCLFATVSTQVDILFITYDSMWQLIGTPTKIAAHVILARINDTLPHNYTTPMVWAIGY